MEDFSTCGLSPSLQKAIKAKGYTTPSPIQAQAIPLLMDGIDLIGQAQTGTGKTAAFGIPLIHEHEVDAERGPVALILVPTRELAAQVSDELVSLAKGTRLEIVAVYGGVGFGKQLASLRRRAPQVVVATPGRLLDLMQRRDIDLGRVRTLVLDEADRMLDMGFVHDVERILKTIPEDRQTMLFSATMPAAVLKLSKRYLYQPETVKIAAKTTTADRVEQFHVRVEKTDKREALMALLADATPERAIVFTRTKHLAKRLALQLQKGGWSAVALQGNMTQNQRERALAAFRDGTARLMVATDVAARGIDVDDVSHVVNFDVPDVAEAYVHRIGRTARMGRAGQAVTFVQGDQTHDLRAIERLSGVRLKRMELAGDGAYAGQGPDAKRVQALVSAEPRPQRQGRPRKGSGGRPRHHEGRSGGGGNGGGSGRRHHGAKRNGRSRPGAASGAGRRS